MEFLLAAVVLLGVAAIVAAPFRHDRKDSAEHADRAARRAELETRKEAKYAEIRDAKMDHASGKLSDADFQRLDRELRAEAIEILKDLDSLDSAP